MINKLEVRNFKCLRNVQIDLEQFTIFVGANGSGKSSILEALNLLCQSFPSEDRNSAFLGNPAQPLETIEQGQSRGSNDFVELVVQLDEGGYRVRTDSKAGPKTGRSNPQQWSGIGCGFTPDIASPKWVQWAQTTQKSPLPRSVLLRLETSNLVQAIPGGNGHGGFANITDGMTSNGRGMHSALANMTLNDPDTWSRLQEDLKQIVPTIKRLRHTVAKPNQPSSLLFDTIGGDSLLASQVSEGTLLVLGLLTALHAPDRPNLILLDDLDRGLHPKAQRELISLLRRLLQANPNLQLLASTHSPYMLDGVEPEEVRMTYLDDGSTSCAPLTRHPKFQKWKDEMHPGELWSLFGEKWVAEQPSTVETEPVEQGESA